MGELGWRLSAFGDEISDDLPEQLRVLRSLMIGFLELRGVWGKNVLHLTDEEVTAVSKACADHGIVVSAIASPVGKLPITQPFAKEFDNLKRIFTIADGLGTRMVRVFSFYPPSATEAIWTETELVEESVARLAAMTEAAQKAGIILLLENEKGIVGDTIARCQLLLDAIASPNLCFAWDPANFVAVGEGEAVSDGWNALGPRTRHLHVKDYRMATKTVVPAGEGDGQFNILLPRLAAVEYDGFLALEPHLKHAGKGSGFSGPDGMTQAATALRALLENSGLAEKRPSWLSGAR